MLIPLTITIAAGLALLALFGGGLLFVRRVALEGAPGLSLRGWRWYPSPLAWILLPLAGLLLWRLFPAFLFLPFLLPMFLLRGRRFSSFFRRRDGDQDDGHSGNGNGGPRRPPWA